MNDLSPEFKENLRKDEAKLTVLIEAGGIVERIDASGSSQLILAHPTDMVIRKSGYICNRTLAIQADKAACDLSREFAMRLRNSSQKIRITLIVKV
jgi:hypothetical protein